MSVTLIFNPTSEVVAAGEDRFEIRLPLWGRQVVANRYQVGLLQQFDRPAVRAEVLTAYPFHRAESERFLDECEGAGVLLSCSEEGEPRLPVTTRAHPGFANAPDFDPSRPAAFTFLGVPMDRNTTGLAGAKFGPSAVRQASEGCRYRLDPLRFTPVGFHDYARGATLLEGVTLADAGDVFMAPGEPSEAIYARITAVTRTLVESGTIPMIIGGDHSITYPILAALPSPSLRVLHLDAHTDLGAPLPGAGLHHGNVFSYVLDKLPYVEHITQVGLRGLIDAPEHQPTDIVTQVGLDALRSHGVGHVLELLDEDAQYFISVDIDVLDPTFAPSTGTPVANGMFPHELKNLLYSVASTRDIVGMDLLEVAQPAGPHDGTAAIASECLLTVADGITKRMQQKLSVTDTGAGGAQDD